MYLRTALFSITILLLAGCSADPAVTPTVAPSPEVSRPETLVNVDEIHKLLQEVETKTGGPVRFLEASVNTAYFEIQVQDPKKPENVDSFQLRNGKLESVPMKTSGAAENITAAAMPLSDWNVAALPTLLAAVKKEGAELEGGKPPHIFVTRGTTGQPEWNVFLSGSRKTVYLTATLGGEIVTLETR